MLRTEIVTREIDLTRPGQVPTEGPVDARRVVGYSVGAMAIRGTWTTGVLELRHGLLETLMRRIPGQPTLTASTRRQTQVRAIDEPFIGAAVTTTEADVVLRLTYLLIVDDEMEFDTGSIFIDLDQAGGAGDLGNIIHNGDRDHTRHFLRGSFDYAVRKGSVGSGTTRMYGGINTGDDSAVSINFTASRTIRRGLDISGDLFIRPQVTVASAGCRLEIPYYLTRGGAVSRLRGTWQDAAGQTFHGFTSSPVIPRAPLAVGQELSAEAYDRIAATYATAHGSPAAPENFVNIDLRSRNVRGRDDMGSGGAANRITDAAADTLGGVLGDWQTTLASGNLPSGQQYRSLWTGGSVSNRINGVTVSAGGDVSSIIVAHNLPGSGTPFNHGDPSTFANIFVIP